MIAEVDKAYAAGVLDSDGSIGGYLSGKNECLKLVITVAVLDERLPLWFKERWGGNIGIQRGPDRKGRPLHRWQLQGMKAGVFVRDCLPYLVSKREQGDLFLRLCSTITANGKHISETNRAMRREWTEELSRLKWV